MAIGKVQEYTRQLANGTQVQVNGHSRSFQPGDKAKQQRRTPVDQYRHERVKAERNERRREAISRGRDAAHKGMRRTRQQAKRSVRMAKRGGKRLQRAARYMGRRRRTMAVCAAAGGLAEVGAAIAYQGAGLVVTSISILAAVLTGGLLIGKERKGANS